MPGWQVRRHTTPRPWLTLMAKAAGWLGIATAQVKWRRTLIVTTAITQLRGRERTAQDSSVSVEFRDEDDATVVDAVLDEPVAMFSL